MAKKASTVFFCTECGNETSKWMGQCPACKAWNTLVEEPVSSSGNRSSVKKVSGSERKAYHLSDISMDENVRQSTGIAEMDRVLGGGIVHGSLTLLGGDPGIGKSTLLLQMCENISRAGKKVLYISGEESLQQIKLRAQRLGSFGDDLLLMCENDLTDIEAVIRRESPEVVIIDSIQTMVNPDVTSSAGSVSQVRESTSVLLQLAKGLGTAIFIVGHVTKEGTVAGPRVLEHMVDTVLYFEGDRYASYRILRGVKNRFGSTNEIGVFEMGPEGLSE
ncbi:MAG: DNA repair protein RadA, partial [Lachnospiraceae bacterium]|nr:DNA repair protein RadA [Lachnospiraceae bacterium]